LIASIESINFSYAKISKSHGPFPDKNSALKLLYLGLRNISCETGGYSGTGTHDWECGVEHTRPLFPERIALC
jgi:transposase-like protein